MAATDIIVRVIDETRAGLSSIKSGLDGLKNSADGFNNNLRTIIASYATIETGKAFLSQIIQVQEFEAKLKLVSKSQNEFNANYQKVFDIAQRNRVPLSESVDLFSKLTRVQDRLGLSAKDVTDVVENFSIILARSGVKGNEAAAVILQFGQALNEGRLNGNEFSRINESIPELLDLIARKSGLAREDLKKLGSEGFISAKILAIALKEGLGELELGQKTLAQSFVQLQNKIQDSVKSFLDSSGAGETLINVVDRLTANFDNLIPILKIAGIALGALAIYVAPVAAAFVAAGAAVVYFANYLGPFAQGVLDVFGFAIQKVSAALAGLGAGLYAIVQGDFSNMFSRMATAMNEYGKSSDNSSTATKGLTTATSGFKKEGQQSTVVSEEMAAALKTQNDKILATKTSYGNLVTALKYNTEASEEDAAVKKYQTELYKFFEAKSKDLQVAVGDLRVEQQKAIEAEVGGLIKSKLANEEALKAREKLYNDSVSFLKKYGEDYDKFANENVTATETFENQKAKLNEQYNIANEYASKNNKTALTQIDEDFRKAMLFLQLKGITDLAKDYKKYSDDAKTDSQKLADDLTKIDEARRIAGVDGESKYQEALQGLRDKFAAKYKTLVENSAQFGLTREQQLQEALTKLDAEAKAVGYTRQTDYETQRQAVIFKSYEDIYKRGQKFTEDNLSNEALYNKNLADLELARAASSQENQKYVNAALLALNKDYIDKTVASFPLLYKAYSDNLMKMLGVSNENVGKMKEVFKLFGYDVDAILKDLFVQGIRYLLGFTNSANQNINSVQGVMNQIFGSQGSASKSILDFSTSGTSTFGSFINGATNLFKSFGSTISSLFSGIGSFISNLFSGSSSILNTALSAITSFAGSATSAVSSVISTVSSAIGLTSAASAATGASAVAAGGAAATAGGSAVAAGSAAQPAIAAGGSAAAAGGSTLTGALTSAFPAFLLALSIKSILDEKDAEKKKKQGLSNALAIVEQSRQVTGAGFNALSVSTLGQALNTSMARPAFAHRSQYGGSVYELRKGGEAVEYRVIDYASVQKHYENLTNGQLFNLNKTYPGITSNIGFDMMNHYVAYGERKYGRKGLANAGGLLTGPTAFNSRSGIAIGGEMGTEAIMPLERTSDGRLGVSAMGGGGVNVNITINAVDSRGIDQLLMERQTLLTNIVRKAVNSRSGSGVMI